MKDKFDDCFSRFTDLFNIIEPLKKKKQKKKNLPKHKTKKKKQIKSKGSHNLKKTHIKKKR